jgi:hypothetical protein
MIVKALIKQRSIVAFQALAMLNGLLIPLAVPLAFTDRESVHIFQGFSIAVLLATCVDCLANALNSAGEALPKLFKINIGISILGAFLLPLLFIYPWINLAISLSLSYGLSNFLAIQNLKRFYPLSPAVQAVATGLAIFQCVSSDSDAFLRAASLYLYLANIALLLFVMRCAKLNFAISAKSSGLPWRAVTQGLLSRSPVLIMQNAYFAVAPLFLPSSDVVIGRVAISAQNMSRFINLLPLSHFAARVGEGRALRGAVVRLVVASAFLMIPASAAILFYARISGIESSYSFIELSSFLFLTTIVTFSPYAILNEKLSHYTILLIYIWGVGLGSLLTFLIFAPDFGFLAIYAAASWITLVLSLPAFALSRRFKER